MKSHGSGMACYEGERPAEGSCEECRAYNREKFRRFEARRPDAVSESRRKYVDSGNNAANMMKRRLRRLQGG